MNMKTWMGLLLKKTLLMPCMLMNGSAPAEKKSRTVVDWKFDSKYFKSGALETNDLVIRDASGNGNDLKLNTQRIREGKKASDYLRFETDSIQGGNEIQSLRMSPGARKEGAFFETVKGAPMCNVGFEDGFTVEVILKLESVISPWSSILGQKGTGKTGGMLGDEPEGSGGLNVSDSNELQWNVWTKNNAKVQTNPTTWSDAGGLQPNKWHHAVIKNDGRHTLMMVDGVKVLRCNMEQEQQGIETLEIGEEKGWTVGTAYWSEDETFSETTCGDAIFKGYIQEIRMTEGILDPKDYLVTEFVPDDSCDIAGNNAPYKPLDRRENYTFVIIPDPQYTTQYKPEITTAETEWIRDHEKQLNIAMTLCVGDVTQSGTENEYQSSDESFQVLDKAGCPYIVVDGNHDSGAPWKREFYLKYFGPHRYENMKEYKGCGPTGISTYFIVRAGSYEYLIVTLPWNDEDVETDRAWVENILKTHSDYPTIIMSHFNEDLSFVKPYDQVFMIVRGHVDFRDAKVIQNDAGHDVIDIVVNYQFDPYGGNGWLRTLEFNEEAGTVISQSYSPWVEKKMKILNGDLENNGILLPDEMQLFPFDKLNVAAHPSDTAVFRLNFEERFANLRKCGK